MSPEVIISYVDEEILSIVQNGPVNFKKFSRTGVGPSDPRGCFWRTPDPVFPRPGEPERIVFPLRTVLNSRKGGRSHQSLIRKNEGMV